jgi:hypothetical protein
MPCVAQVVKTNGCMGARRLFGASIAALQQLSKHQR